MWGGRGAAAGWVSAAMSKATSRRVLVLELCSIREERSDELKVFFEES